MPRSHSRISSPAAAGDNPISRKILQLGLEVRFHVRQEKGRSIGDQFGHLCFAESAGTQEPEHGIGLLNAISVGNDFLRDGNGGLHRKIQRFHEKLNRRRRRFRRFKECGGRFKKAPLGEQEEIFLLKL